MLKNKATKFAIALIGIFSLLTPILALAAAPSPNFSLTNNKRIYFEISPRAEAKIQSDFKDSAKANRHKGLITDAVKKTYSILENNSNLPNFTKDIDLSMVKIVTENEINLRCKDTVACYYLGEGTVLFATSAFEMSDLSPTFAYETIAHEFIHSSAHNFPEGNLVEGIVEYLACQAVNCSTSYDITYKDEYLVVTKMVEKAGLNSSVLFSVLKESGYDGLDKMISPVQSKEIDTLLKVGTKAKIDTALEKISTITPSIQNTTQTAGTTSTVNSSNSTSTSPSQSSSLPAPSSSPSATSTTGTNQSFSTNTPSSSTTESSEGITIKINKEEIISGESFVATIQNSSKDYIKYEVLVDDIKTGNMVKKSSGAVASGENKKVESIITGIGDHKVAVRILHFNDEKLIKNDTFQLVVKEKALSNASSAAASPTKTNVEEYDGPSCTDGSCPITNSNGGIFDIGLKKLFPEFFEDDPTTADLSSIEEIIKRIINLALDMAGIAAFIMVLWAARAYLNAYGSEEKAAMGKKTLIWALVGVIVVAFAKMILLWLYDTLKQ